MSKKFPTKKLELKGLSPLNKSKPMAEKSSLHKALKKNFRLPLTSKPIQMPLFGKKPRGNKVARSNENSLIPTVNSETPKTAQKRGFSLSSYQNKKPGIEFYIRKLSVNPVVNVVAKYATASQTGFIPDYPQKENQDAFIELSEHDFHIFGVLDGHGVNGGHVSNYIKSRLPVLIKQNPRDLLDTIKVSVLATNEEVGTVVDSNFSGCTLNLIIINFKKLYCANVGDSRAIIGNQVNDISSKASSGKNWMAVALSRDHKPDLAEEAERIYKNGGRVMAYSDKNGEPAGPARVWLSDKNIPGLAMSRSLGDYIVKAVGVVADPEILEYELSPQDKFIVIGSDGLFEFLSNEEVIKIVVPYWKTGNASGASLALAQAAEIRWKDVSNT